MKGGEKAKGAGDRRADTRSDAPDGPRASDPSASAILYTSEDDEALRSRTEGELSLLGTSAEQDAANEPSDESGDERTEVGGGARVRIADDVGAGTVLAQRYQIEASLGEGGSGTVYRAWDRMLGELIAVKILHAQRAREKSWIKRLAREVRVARAIRHPNVCRVFELGHADNHWFVTMELATRGSLRDLLRGPSQPAARPLTERLRDMRELCAGLAAMHAVAITHRDVTPQNVLRMADGRLVLTDFGLAIESGDQTTVHGGTPAYMPPEVARGQLSDQRSDVFQLGMIMHEVLTGVRPTWSPDGSRLQLTEPEAGASAVEEELHRLVGDCLALDPARRPPSAVAVAGRLAAAESARPAPFTTRVILRGKRFVMRHQRLMLMAATTVVLGAVFWTVQVVARPPLCRGGAQQMAGVWDPSRAEAVRRAFLASGKTYAPETFARLRALLDDYVHGWVRMYTDACEATHLRGEQSAEVLDLRMSCLKDEQGQLRALTDLFSSADGEVVWRSINAASALPPVSRCADVRVLRAVVRPPSDPATQQRVELLRQSLSEVKALQGAGRLAESSRKVAPLIAEARTIGYEPLLAEALAALGHSAYLSGPPELAESTFEEALLVAESSRHDRVLAEVAVDRISWLGTLGRLDEMRRFVPRAEATLRRIGGDQRLQGWIYAGQGQALNLNGLYAASLEMHEKGLAAKRAVLPAEHWDVALSLGSIASCLHSLGRDAEALAQNERAIAMLERTLGRGHPELALHLYNRGEIRLALGQVTAARADFQRTLEIWRQELPPDHLYNSYPLTGLGMTYLHEGDGGLAMVSLERALTIRQQANASPEMRAETMFALAQALWSVPAWHAHERARAVTLAESALELVPQTRGAEREKIRAFLADAHRSDRGGGIPRTAAVEKSSRSD